MESDAKRRGRRSWLVAVLAVTGGLALAAIAWTVRRSNLPPPNILMVVIDSLRADRVGSCGSPQRLTPFLDRLAAESLVYDRAYSPSSWTVPSVVSLFTGEMPSEHGFTKFFANIAPDKTTIAEALSARGYATFGVSANNAISGMLGFGRGFDEYKIVGNPTFASPKEEGGLVNAELLRLLDLADPRQPVFAYLHYMDAHMPYRSHPDLTPPRAAGLDRSDESLNGALIWGRSDFSIDDTWRLQDLYDGEVRYTDGLLRDLFAQLEQRGFLRDALVIVTADHGEEFGAHGAFGHGTSLFEASIHVPLIIRTPDKRIAHIAQPVQIAGLAAFIVGSASAARPPSMDVASLPTTVDTRHAPAPVLSELVASTSKTVWSHKQALIVGAQKLVVTPDDEQVAYDLHADPFERRPHAPDPLLTRALADTLKQLRAAGEVRQITPDDATRERLRAAGYLND